MAAPRSSPSPPPPPPQARSTGGGAHVSLFLDTDLGTHLALNVAADSTIRHLKSQVAVEHAAAFPDLGPVAVKSFQVLRKGAMYHLSDSMAVRSAFAKVKAGCFLHVKMAAVETETHCCRYEDRVRSSEGCLGVDVYKRVRDLPAMISEIASDVLPQRLEGGEDAAVLNNVHAHDAVPNDVLLSSSSQQTAERKENEAVSLASDVGTISVPVIDKPKSYKQGIKHGDQTEGAYVNSRSVANVNRSTNQSNVSQDRKELHSRKEDLLHSVGDHDLGVVSGNKQVGIKEGTLEEIHALDDLSQEKELKKARKTGSFDTSAAAPIREINDSETRDVNKLDRVPLETNTNSRGVLSSTSFQQEVHGDVQEDSMQLENPIVAGKNKKRKKRQSVKSVVSAQEMTKPSIGAVEEPKTIGEGLLHEDNQGLQGGGAYNVEMTSRDKTMVRPSDMLLSSSQLYIGIQGTKHDEVAVEASDMEKGSKSMNVLETIDTDGNTSQEKNCKKEKKVSSVGIASRDTAEEKDQCGYGEKAVKSDMFSAQGEIANDPYKQQISSDSNVIENPNADGKRKKKRRRHSESSKDDPTQDATKSSGFITNRSSTQNTNSQPLDAKQTTLGTIGEATAEEKDHCRDEKAAKLVIICTQGEIVNDPINVQQGDHNVIENPDGDGKRRKTKRRRLESSKTDPTQDVTKSSRFITNGSSTQNTSADPLDAKQTTPGTIGEATVSDCKKFDESLSVATANVIDEVLADLRCTDSLSKGLHGDPLTEQTHLGSNQNVLWLLGYTGNKGGVSAVLPPKYPAAIQSDAPISSPSHKKSKRKQLKVLSTVLDSSHSSGGVPEENVNTELRESDSLRFSDKISDLKDVLTDNTIAQGDDRTKATKHQRKKISLKHVPTDSGEATQSSGKQVSQVPAEELKGANATKAKLVQGGSVIDTLASAVQKVQQKSKRFSKTQIPKIQEINHSVHGQDSQFAKDRQEEYVSDIGGTHDNENAVGAPTESPVVQEDATTVTYDNPNARKGRKKSSKAELRNQDTALEHDSDADLINSRARRGKVSSKSSADAVEPNDYVAVHPDNDKINFLDHFSPGGTNGPSDSAENNEDETMREVKGKKKSKRKSDKQSHRSGSIEPNDPLESHLHTDKSSLTDHFGTGNVGVPSVSAENNNHFGTGNVGVPSVSAENNNRENGGVKKAKEKKKSKGTSDLVKPESENPSGDHQDTDSCTQNSVYSVVQKGRMGQDNGKEKSDKVIQNNGMLQRETEDATCDSTLEKKSHQSMFDADSQNYLPIDKDHAPMSKEQRNSASQTKHYAKSRNHDGSINGRTGPNLTAVSNIVKSFSMSPPASSESAEGIPHNASRYRVAVRKVPRKRYGQVSDKSKKDTSKRGTGAIFSDAISEGSDDVLDIMSEKAAMETSSDDSSTSADSGISSAAQDGSDVPDDDGIIPLSQRSLKGGLHIGSILRGSSSYKKARQKQTEQLDDIEVPDSQPQDGL